MPRIPLRQGVTKFTPQTRDRKKTQTRFDHDPDVLALIRPRQSAISPEIEAMANQLGKSLAKSLNDMIVGVDVAWADEDKEEDVTFFTTQYFEP